MSDERESTQGWMTIADAAKLLGVSDEAVRQKVKRRTLRARKGNDGRLQVMVETLLTQGQPKTDQPKATQDSMGEINALREHVQTLREDKERLLADLERGRVDRAAADAVADAERTRMLAGHAAAVSKLEQQLRAAEDRAGKADARADDVLAEVRALREALEDARRPWWRRLLKR
jgi:excisionase family DNA binding protein